MSKLTKKVANMKVTLIQKQLNALLDRVVDTTVIGEFKNKESALDFLSKRNYKYDSVKKAYITGNTVQYPVTLEVKDYGMFDIRSFT